TSSDVLSQTARTRWRLALLFVGLVVAFAAGLWGTILRPAAYEVRGELVARAAPDLILVRHETLAVLGMSALEQMASPLTPAPVAPLAVKPGAQLRPAVRQAGDRLVLVRIERR